MMDSLIGGLKSDTIAFIAGSGITLQAAERYCVRAQLPPARGGLNGGAFFIDGGTASTSTSLLNWHTNTTSPTIRHSAASCSRAPSRSTSSRSLIESSAAVFATKRPRLLVISEIFSLFNEDVEKTEARRVIHDIASSISEISEREEVPILITSASRPELLVPILEERCNVSAEITEGDHYARSCLFKHPWKVPLEALTETGPTNYNQDTLQAEAKYHG